jgi:hypothetical protein
MRLFIFGAGATIGTLGKPGVKGFGKALQRDMRTWRSKFGALASVVDALEPGTQRRSAEDWDLDAAWTHIDYVAIYRALGTGHFPGFSCLLVSRQGAGFDPRSRRKHVKRADLLRLRERRHQILPPRRIYPKP